MVNLVSGILLVSNVILTVVALIRCWRWKAVLPIFFGVSFTFVVAMVAGLFIGTIFSTGTNILLAGIINIFVQCIATIVLIFMVTHKPTDENISLLKSILADIKNKMKLKQVVYFFGLTFLVWFVLCFSKGFLGVEGGGKIYNFLLIISAILSGVILKIFKKDKIREKD